MKTKTRGIGGWTGRVVAGLFCAYVLWVIVGLFVVIPMQHRRAYGRLMTADSSELLAACRDMISRHAEFHSDHPDVTWLGANHLILDSSIRPFGTNVPEAIRSLDPLSIGLDEDVLQIRLNSPGTRAYVFAFSEGQDGYGDQRLLPGLWWWGGGQLGAPQGQQLSRADSASRTRTE